MFDVSAEGANFWFDISNLVLLVGAVLVAVGTYGAIKFSGIKEKFADERISANETETKRAVAESDKANAALGIAQADIAKANVRIAEANARTAEAEAKLAETRQKIDIRRLNEAAFAARLKGVAPQPVLVSHGRGDPEALILSMPIVGALERLGWKASYIEYTSPEVEQCARLGGVVVLSKDFSADGQTDMERKPADRTTPFLALADALWNGIGENSTSFATCPFVEEGVLQIVIGPKLIVLPK